MERDREWLKDTFRNAGDDGRSKTSPRILLDDALRKFRRAGQDDERENACSEPTPLEPLEAPGG